MKLDRDYWIKYYEKVMRRRHITLFNSYLKDRSGTLLVVGCGTGDFIKPVLSHFELVLGIDILAESLFIANKSGILAIRGCLNHTFPFVKENVDLVLADQVIEHIINRDIFVREMYRVLKHGGSAIISTENLSSWNNVLAITVGKQALELTRYIPFTLR
jgi:2-polyprenyl-3-methyl-5-hydroxy-6-metoxy-1,4-benzoquinol methylase